MKTNRMIKGAAIAAALFVAMSATVVVALSAPNLMAAFFVKGKVGLKWSKVEGATEYVVLRKEAGNDYAEIGTTDGDRFFDAEVSGGKTYVYKVAVREGGELVASGEKSVSIPGAVGGFKAPSWVGLRFDRRKVFANWDDVPGAVAYNVWRSATSGGGYEIVGTSEASRFVDSGDGLVPGQTYYYTLTAMNAEFEETPQSAELSIKFGVSAEERENAAAAEEKIELVPVTLKHLFEIDVTPDGRQLNQPSDLAVAANGDIYLADTVNSLVHCYDASGKPRFSIGEAMDQRVQPADYVDGGFLMPFTLALDAQQNLYVGDIQRNDIQVFKPDGTFLRRIQVDNGEAAALRPNGLAVLSDGRLVMTDAGNHRVLVTDANGQVLEVIGKRSLEEGGFNFPDQLTVVGDERVFVVDALNTRVVEFDIKGEFVSAFGSAGHSAGTFGRPKGIAVDPEGDLWVSDGMSHLVQRFSASGEVKSVLGGNNDEYSFESPRGMWFTGDRMFVVERTAKKVSVYQIEAR